MRCPPRRAPVTPHQWNITHSSDVFRCTLLNPSSRFLAPIYLSTWAATSRPHRWGRSYSLFVHTHGISGNSARHTLADDPPTEGPAFPAAPEAGFERLTSTRSAPCPHSQGRVGLWARGPPAKSGREPLYPRACERQSRLPSASSPHLSRGKLPPYVVSPPHAMDLRPSLWRTRQPSLLRDHSGCSAAAREGPTTFTHSVSALR
ncbi:hypothetical protein GY45DRAFT_635829 [Cubamyces sp. BRFM 1775]|nr:hypothetical protein GY45DRAFT_635829 [Cubamyces sp. BRFM 1775]